MRWNVRPRLWNNSMIIIKGTGEGGQERIDVASSEYPVFLQHGGLFVSVVPAL